MTTTVDSRRETISLIGSDKVEGTAVYGADRSENPEASNASHDRQR